MRQVAMSIGAAWLLAAAMAAPGSAQETVARYEPGATKVVILPMVCKTAEFGDKWDVAVRPSAEKAVIERFTSRGFAAVPMADVARQVNESKIDLSDRENWAAPVITGLAKALSGRIVVLLVVESAQSKVNDNGWGWLITSRVGMATVRVRMLDTTTGRSLLDAAKVDSKTTSSGLGNFDKSLSRETRAVVMGFDRALKPFLDPYPVTSVASGKSKD